MTVSLLRGFTGVVTKREINETEKHIKCQSVKSMKNMETCAYNTGYYEWLCVRMLRRITQYLASKRVSTCW